jgi:hypothetical protein
MVGLLCGNYAAAKALLNELVPLAEEKGTSYWKAFGMMEQGWLLTFSAESPSEKFGFMTKTTRSRMQGIWSVLNFPCSLGMSTRRLGWGLYLPVSMDTPTSQHRM